MPKLSTRAHLTVLVRSHHGSARARYAFGPALRTIISLFMIRVVTVLVRGHAPRRCALAIASAPSKRSSMCCDIGAEWTQDVHRQWAYVPDLASGRGGDSQEPGQALAVAFASGERGGSWQCTGALASAPS